MNELAWHGLRHCPEVCLDWFSKALCLNVTLLQIRYVPPFQNLNLMKVSIR
jgi:hypothetical protein